MAARTTTGPQQVSDVDQQTLVLSEIDHDQNEELRMHIFTGRESISEDLPIDGELIVRTTNDEETLLKDNDIDAGSLTNDTSDNNSVSPRYIMSEGVMNDRRYKDMMRKRQLRTSSDYRQQETVKSRNRMKARRSDPAYREKERERDRERRKLARLNNPEKRAAERERDRLYKKRLRDDHSMSFVANSVSHEIILIDNSGVNPVVFEPVMVNAAVEQ